jgi:hypothetical protein
MELLESDILSIRYYMRKVILFGMRNSAELGC